MRRPWLFVSTVVLALAAASSAAQAQDPLASIVTKKRISAHDRAVIATEVAQRAKRLEDAGSDPDRRRSAVDELVKTTRTAGATKAGLDTYAEACAKALSSLTTHERFETGFAALAVLLDLDNAATAPALTAALTSSHAANRYRAALGLLRLHKKIAKDQGKVRRALQALGAAGAAEEQEVVLKMIYRAIDFGSDVRESSLARGSAAALNRVFKSRLARLDAGKHDATPDLLGFEAVTGCYADAGTAEQTKLMANMAAFLVQAVDRHFSQDSHQDSRPASADLIKTIESTIHDMVKAAAKAVPSNRISDTLRKGRKPTTRMEQSARKAMGELLAVLNGDPWNLPLP